MEIVLKWEEVFQYFFDDCRKIRLDSKLMKSQPGKQTVTMQILPNLSQSKDKRTMKFGQLIECNNRSIFHQKSLRNLRQGD